MVNKNREVVKMIRSNRRRSMRVRESVDNIEIYFINEIETLKSKCSNRLLVSIVSITVNLILIYHSINSVQL